MPVGSHMVLEPLLLFETVYVENRSVADLLDPDTSYRSPLLDGMVFRGFPPRQTEGQDPWREEVSKVDNVKFTRLPIKDKRYGGILNNAAVMTMTSGSQETHPSPVFGC